jgi:enamine deaminase RidA (YjgF/YER057c/UK114 family)
MPNGLPDGGADARFLALPDEMPPLLKVPAELSFVNVRRSADRIWLAGHTPNRKMQPPQFDYTGKVGRDLTKEEGYDAARLVGLNLLVSLRNAIGSLDRVGAVLQVIGMVNSASGFTEQSYVINGCTDLMVSVFQDAGRPTRMVFGAFELPFNIAVEASMVVEIRPASADKA